MDFLLLLNPYGFFIVKSVPPTRKLSSYSLAVCQVVVAHFGSVSFRIDCPGVILIREVVDAPVITGA